MFSHCFSMRLAGCFGCVLLLRLTHARTNTRARAQIQADFLNVEVVRPVMIETTAIGAAVAAGLATGVPNPDKIYMHVYMQHMYAKYVCVCSIICKSSLLHYYNGEICVIALHYIVHIIMMQCILYGAGMGEHIGPSVDCHVEG